MYSSAGYAVKVQLNKLQMDLFIKIKVVDDSQSQDNIISSLYHYKRTAYPLQEGGIACLSYSAKVLRWLTQMWPDWPGFGPAATFHVERAPARTRPARPLLGIYGGDRNIDSHI
jgi:hypothetical protein